MDGYIWLLWDILAVIMIVYCVRRCARQGLVRTVIGFFSYFIAAFGARAFSPRLAQFFYDYIVRDTMVLVINSRLEEALIQGREVSGEIVDLLPALLRYFLPPSATTGADYAAAGTGDIVEGIIDVALEGPILFLLQGASFFLLFSAIIFVVRRIARMFTGIYRIPVIGSLNTLLGGIVGVLEAVLFLFVGAFLIGLVIFMTKDELAILNYRVMDDTFIWRVFFNRVIL